MPDDVIFPDQRDAGLLPAKKKKKEKAPKAPGDDSVRTLIFAAIACVIVSGLLAFAQQSWKGKIKENAISYQRENIIKAFGVETENVDQAFKKHIVTTYLDTDGGKITGANPEDKIFRKQLEKKEALTLYTWYEDASAAETTSPTSYVIPVSGYGLWSTIYGFLGLEADMDTIRAVTFYKHGETAGLGAECSEDWFQEQFEGKELRGEEGGLADFKIMKGRKIESLTDEVHAVGGIAASTITSDGIQKFLNKDIALFEPYFSKLLASTGKPADPPVTATP